MSNAIFPVLPGLGYSVVKTPHFKTVTQSSTSGKEVRVALMSYPLWQFTLSFEFLRGGSAYSEFQTLAGFFNARLGSYDSFLFDDPTDDTASLAAFGVGDGVTKIFQLTRALGGFTEPIQNINGAPLIYVGSSASPVSSSTYSIGSTGIVTFNTAPAAGASLWWSGKFFFRCRFLQDSAEFDQFMQNFWSLKRLQMQSVKL